MTVEQFGDAGGERVWAAGVAEDQGSQRRLGCALGIRVFDSLVENGARILAVSNGPPCANNRLP
jgi:hypothetical protein